MIIALPKKDGLASSIQNFKSQILLKNPVEWLWLENNENNNQKESFCLSLNNSTSSIIASRIFFLFLQSSVSVKMLVKSDQLGSAVAVK